jgi:predicted RND superfamily exporter protein
MERLARFALSRPIQVALILLVMTSVIASQLVHLESETGYRAYLGHEHPTIKKLDSFIDGFGGGLPMGAAWSCDDTVLCDRVFDESALRMAHAVVSQLRNRSEIRRIESPDKNGRCFRLLLYGVSQCSLPIQSPVPRSKVQ